MIRKTYHVERKTIDADAGVFEAMITTEELDRDGDIIIATGVDIEPYLKNPVVLFGHQYGDANAVVGKATEVEVIPGQGIRARWQFAPADTNPNAGMVGKLWAGGFLNATSVGFIPKDVTDIGGEIGKGRIYNTSELLEFSIVSVPANANALRLAYETLAEKPPEPKSAEKDADITDSAPQGAIDEPAEQPDVTQPITDAPQEPNDEITQPGNDAELLELLGEFLIALRPHLLEETE